MTTRLTTATFVAFGALLFTVALLALPDSVNWRDSGEFLISAFYLDIPHPAGFPTYSQCANALTLLLPGPIAWRTHVFSLFVCVSMLLLCIRLAEELSKDCGLKTTPHGAALVVGTSLIPTQPYWRAITTAEVYGLHAVIMLVVLRLILVFIRTSDVRFLLCAAFIGGIGLGNHVVAALFAAWTGLCLIGWRRVSVKNSLATLFCVGLGTLIYCYLPVRATTPLPLNTGSPSTIHRFIHHISDARDRQLRPKSDSPKNSLPSHPIRSFGSDVMRALQDTPKILLPFLLIGLIKLCFVRPIAAAITLGIPVTTLLFFSGWDPEPWIPALATVAIFTSLGLQTCAHALRDRFVITTRLEQGVIVVLACASLLSFLPILGDRAKTTTSSSAIHFATQTLHAAPTHGVFVVDASWFIVKYAQAVEGVQPYLISLYAPSILFPAYFNPALVSLPQGAWKADTIQDPQEPALPNAFALLQSTARYGPIVFEPNETLLTPLRNIIQLDPNGIMMVRHNQPSTFADGFIGGVVTKLVNLVAYADRSNSSERNDIDEHLRTLLIQYSRTFLGIGRADLLSDLCARLDASFIGINPLPKTHDTLIQICITP